jgi:hypothetical protein
MNWYVLWNIIIVFLFGSFWGFAELLQRYKEWKYVFHCQKNKKKERDKESQTNTKDSVIGYVISYIILNGLISVIALWLIKFFAKDAIATMDSIEFQNTLLAGFGGMMILRSSIFSIKQHNKDIEIGLATVVKIFLDTIDRKINHNIAARRVCDIYEIMKDVDFELAKEELPALCIEFIDYFTDEDSKNLTKKITEINGDFNNINKSLQLGREIAKYCNTEILRRVIKKLPHIKKETEGETKEDEFEARKLKLNS